MKQSIKTVGCFLFALLLFTSCRKTPSHIFQNSNQAYAVSASARAGADQVVLLPTDSVMLNGSISTGLVATFQWTQVSGPSPSSIQKPSALQTIAKNLTVGIYLFELAVRYSPTTSLKDTVQITVTKTIVPFNQFSPFATLSEPRYRISAGTVGSKIVFAAGADIQPCFIDSEWGWGDCINDVRTVDIYDTANGSWSKAQLSGRHEMEHYGTCGAKMFFAIEGGKVDIYDAASKSWSTATLSQLRYGATIISAAGKIFFAGGDLPSGGNSSRIDIYDSNSNSWSVKQLPDNWFTAAGASVGNKVMFLRYGAGAATTTRIDIYDMLSGTWSSTNLSEDRGGVCAVTLGNKIVFSGGYRTPANQGTTVSSRVDIYDDATQTWSQANVNFWGNTDNKAITFNNKILFNLHQGGRVTIYDGSTNSWSEVDLKHRYHNMAIVAVGNNLYAAGGTINGSSTTNQVWKIQ